MQYIEYKNPENFTDLPFGEWTSEPDKVQWEDEETKLPCLIVRNSIGALCGYVGVNSSSKFYEKEYGEIDGLFDVHGCLTFSDKFQKGNECDSICHSVNKDEDDNIWWLGFDCAHSGDLVPSMLNYSFGMSIRI